MILVLNGEIDKCAGEVEHTVLTRWITEDCDKIMIW